MSVTEEFEQTVVDVKNLAQRPSDDVLLKLYALYKQGTKGDAGGGSPGVFDVVGRAKFGAWKALAGVAPEDAQRQYVALVRELRTGTA